MTSLLCWYLGVTIFLLVISSSFSTPTISSKDQRYRHRHRRGRGGSDAGSSSGGVSSDRFFHRKTLIKTKGTIIDDDDLLTTITESPAATSFSTKTPTKSPRPFPPTLQPTSRTPTSPVFPPNTTPTSSPGQLIPTTPTILPTSNSVTDTNNSPLPTFAPSTITPNNDGSSGLLSPVEIEEERSRTRALLPFSLEVKNDQVGIDVVDQVVEMYLFRRLAESFFNLEWVLLTVTANTDPTNRRGTRQRRLQLQEQPTSIFDFSGVAIFLDPEQTMPTDLEVQRAQLQALEDFQRMNEFIPTQGSSNWQIDKIVLDGMTINKDGILMGDNMMENDGDTLVRGPEAMETSEDTNQLALALSLGIGLLFVGGVLSGLFLTRRQNRSPGDGSHGKETYEGLIHSLDEDSKLREPGPTNSSFESTTIATMSFDSTQLSTTTTTTEYIKQESTSDIDWDRVFALSQKPVEETMGEIFEPKKLAPPPINKIHEIVMLAPVTEGGGENDNDDDDDDDDDDDTIPMNEERPGDEDSYGYDTLPEEGVNDSFVLSSPVAQDDFVPRGDHYNQDRDLTIDLSDFNIEGTTR